MRIRSCRLLFMRVVDNTKKGTSGIGKFGSVVDRVHMELGGMLLDTLRTNTQFLERRQRRGVAIVIIENKKWVSKLFPALYIPFPQRTGPPPTAPSCSPLLPLLRAVRPVAVPGHPSRASA
jgi:hypothetical protein